MALASRIAADLIVPVGLVESIAASASHEYKRYRVPKRSGGYRTIDHPSRRLKAIQRWILHHLINRWPVHDAAFAYRRGLNIREHAMSHVNSHFLLRMDFTNFFPSITSADLATYLKTKPTGTEDWEARDFLLLSQLVTRSRVLTIGAPTSPALSNALCFQLDGQLVDVARGFGATYTRYADDLFFSTRKPEVLNQVASAVQNVVSVLDLPKGLVINADKTRHSSKRGERRVTGLVLSPNETISPGRLRKRRVRSQLHKFELLSASARRQLAGELAYLFSIQPSLENILILKYGRQRIMDARHPPL